VVGKKEEREKVRKREKEKFERKVENKRTSDPSTHSLPLWLS